jgi:hypothetical protein
MENGARLLRAIWDDEYRQKRKRADVDKMFVVNALAVIRDVAAADIESVASHRAVLGLRPAWDLVLPMRATGPIYYSAEIKVAQAARALLHDLGERDGDDPEVKAREARDWCVIVRLSDELAAERPINWTSTARQFGITRQGIQDRVHIRSLRTLAALRAQFPLVFADTTRRPRTGRIWGASTVDEKLAA